MGPASTQRGRFPSAGLGLLGSQDEVTAQKSALRTLSSSPVRGGRHGRPANGSQQGSEARHAPPAGSQELPASANQTERARGFLSKEARRFTLSRGREPSPTPAPSSVVHAERHGQGSPAPWSVLRAADRWRRGAQVSPEGLCAATGTPGTGNRGQGRGREGGAVRPAEKPLVRVWPQGAELQPLLMATGWSASVFWRGLLSPRQWAMAAVSQGAVGAGAAPREHRKQGDLAPVLGPQVRGQREGPGGCRCPLACATCSGACPRGLWLPPHAPVSGFPSYKDTGHRIGPT